MAKFRVYLVAGASCTVEVEAEDREEAAETVFNKQLPYADAFCGFELGDWEFASDSNRFADPDDDIEEIADV